MAPVISAIALYSFVAFEDVANRALPSVAGQVTRVERARHVVSFRLEGDDAVYEYFSISGGMGAVESALTTGTTVEIRYDDRSDTGEDQPRHEVLELIAGGRVVRSQAEVANSRVADNRAAGGIAVAFALGSIYLLRRARRAKRGPIRMLRLPS